MKRNPVVVAAASLCLSVGASAGDVDVGAVIGGAVGGGVGAGVGSKVGGTTGAVIGGAIGGATGAAIGSSGSRQDETSRTVVVKERVVVREAAGDDHPAPPGHSRGKKKGWKKHH